MNNKKPEDRRERNNFFKTTVKGREELDKLADEEGLGFSAYMRMIVRKATGIKL